MLQLLEYRAFVGRPQIQQQLRSMQVSLSVPEDAADARRSKKRVSEDVDSPRLEQFLPVKFQHDLHHSQVGTVASKDPRSHAFFRILVLKVDLKGLGSRVAVLSADSKGA